MCLGKFDLVVYVVIKLVLITFVVSCSNSVKFTHEGKVLIVVRVVGPPSFTNCEHMKSKQHDCNETPQQYIEHSTLSIPTAASSSSEALHLNHTNGMPEPLSSPFSIIGVPFSESSPPTVSRAETGFFSSGSKEFYSCDYQNTCAAKNPNNRQRDEMAGDVVDFSEMQQTEEQNSASSLSRRNAGDWESSANTEKVVEDIVWLEFHIIDTGIGISGISTTNI